MPNYTIETVPYLVLAMSAMPMMVEAKEFVDSIILIMPVPLIEKMSKKRSQETRS